MKQYFQYPTSKYPTKKTLLICFFLTLFAGHCLAADTYDWIGTNSTDWQTPQNWLLNNALQSATGSYPGQSAANDKVDIGLNKNFTTAQSPVLNATLPQTIKSIEFGGNNGVAMSLTIGTGVTLTVTSNITQDNNGNGGTATAGSISTTITGLGTIACGGDFGVGDNTRATKPANGTGNTIYTTVINSSISNLTVSTGSLILSSDSRSSGNGGSTDFYNPVFNLVSGNLSVSDIKTDAQGNFATGNTSSFNMDIGTDANTLILLGTTMFSHTDRGASIDFVSTGTLAASTVVYGASGVQNISTNTDGTNDGINITPSMYPNLAFSGGNKTVRAGTLSIAGGLTTGGGTVNLSTNHSALTIAGDWNNSISVTQGTGAISITGDINNNTGGTINEGTATVTISGNLNNTAGTITGNTTSGITTVAGTLTNSGTITVNKETITYTGSATNAGIYTGGTSTTGTSTFNGSFTNSGGSFTAGTGTITFNGDFTNSAIFTPNTTGSIIFGGSGTQAMADNSTNGTSLIKVQIQGSGTKTMSGSKGFFLTSAGELTMGGTATLDCGGVFTLQSDSTGSAIVDALPPGTSITGNANVQRFIEGSSSLNRGYRLMSSTVFTGSPGGINVYDFNYLITSNFWVSGAGSTANGFNVTTTQNPSIYLFREDDPPPPSPSTIFTTGYNWKGVAKINNPLAYNIGTQAKTTTANVNDFTTTIPVGNGFLLFDRGDNSVTTGRLTAPFVAPGDVTLTAVGQLNTGTINVIPWFTGSTAFSYTVANISARILTGGYALVGNPYPSTINWEKYNNGNASGALTGTIGSLTIWEFNPTTKNYGTYLASGNANTTGELPVPANATNGATNFIASGMGFFVKATGAGQTLTFTENAKVTKNGSSAILKNLMGKPVKTAAQPVAYVRLKLITDSINNDDIVIRLDNKASPKFVNNEDAQDLGGSGSLESLSSFSSDSVTLAINGWPFPGKQPQVIRLLANATASGSYQLAVPEFGNIPKLYDVWLKDAFTADSVQLKLNTSYPFTIDKSNAATFGNSRFTVVIRQDSAYAYKLLDFTATKVDRQSDVQLVWKTVNEENYTRFTVERSTDNGKTFTVVGGKLGTGAGTYSLVDKNPDRGRNLYRLKQQDINDSVTYSKVIDVQFGNVFSRLHIFPNPATHTINLAIAGESYYTCSYSIRFINSSGRIVKSVESSQPEWRGNIGYLMPGTYWVRVINNKTQNLVGENKFVKL